jgi:hypothetical protein
VSLLCSTINTESYIRPGTESLPLATIDSKDRNVLSISFDNTGSEASLVIELVPTYLGIVIDIFQLLSLQMFGYTGRNREDGSAC